MACQWLGVKNCFESGIIKLIIQWQNKELGLWKYEGNRSFFSEENELEGDTEFYHERKSHVSYTELQLLKCPFATYRMYLLRLSLN